MSDDTDIPEFLQRKEVQMASVSAETTKKPKPVKAKPPKKEKPVKAKPEGKADAFGFKEGSLKSRAALMYASKNGATLQEVKKALGSVQLNLLKELEGKGHKVKREKEDGNGARQVTRYYLSK